MLFDDPRQGRTRPQMHHFPVPMKNEIPHVVMENPWSTGIFGCFEDIHSCKDIAQIYEEKSCLTFWCPCVTFGRMAEIVDHGTTSCMLSGTLYALLLSTCWLHWFHSWAYRSKLRGQIFLIEEPCHDFLLHVFCDLCALCQEYRELQNRGFEMPIGWHGNVERTRRIAEMCPPQSIGMER